MQIHNPSKLPTIDYRTVKPLQGNLKDLSTDAHDKLLAILNGVGFTGALFLWESPDKEFFIIDGHQRHRTMTLNELHDNGSYDIPYVAIPAPTINEAKRRLLEHASDFGETTPEGLTEFLAEAELDLADLNVTFDNIDFEKMTALDDPEGIEPEEKEATVKEVRFTTEQLRTLAKSIYPNGLPTIMDFLRVIDERSDKH